jgi:sigma-B regulation protein RsbU (phosphoserine phosphatase)
MNVDFAGIVQSITEGLYVVDRDRRIIFWNRGAEKITGWKAEEVVGTHCSDGILEHTDAAGHRLCHSDFCPLHRSIVTRTPRRITTIVYSRTRSGSRIPVEVTTAPYLDAGETLIGGVEVFRDISAAVADMEQARLIQLDAISREPPRLEGLLFEYAYHPHDILGGDFFRMGKLSDTRCALLLADVTSHGVPAALYTLLLRSLWEELEEDRENPARFASRLNSRLVGYSGASGYFASALYGIFDLEKRVLDFCSMGSPPFLHLSAAGDLGTRAVPGNLLGIDESLAFEPCSASFEPGDSMLFFTDGAYEVESPDGRPFGIEGVERHFRDIGAHATFADFCSALEMDLLDYSRGLQLPDDFTAVLARFS